MENYGKKKKKKGGLIDDESINYTKHGKKMMKTCTPLVNKYRYLIGLQKKKSNENMNAFQR